MRAILPSPAAALPRDLLERLSAREPAGESLARARSRLASRAPLESEHGMADLWFKSPHGGRVEGVEIDTTRPILYRGRKWVAVGMTRETNRSNGRELGEWIEFHDKGVIEGAAVSDVPQVLN